MKVGDVVGAYARRARPRDAQRLPSTAATAGHRVTADQAGAGERGSAAARSRDRPPMASAIHVAP